MIRIEMEPNIKNYLVRLLEQKEKELKSLNAKNIEYDLTLIKTATARLNGVRPQMDLSKNISPIRFGLTEEE